jgi:hypothetical protein
LKIAAATRKNLYVYAAFLAIVILGMAYGNALLQSEGNLRVLDVATLLMLLLGMPFLFLQAKAKLPDFLDKQVENKWRWIFPLATGMFFGLFDVLVFKFILHPEPYTSLPPFLQPFPYSLLLYFSGAFEVEVFYRLIPITLFMLAGAYYKKGRYLELFFYAAAILTSLREPLEQLSGENWVVMLYILVSGFSMNLLQALFYRKAGFLSSLSIRLGHYLLWHILLGVYVQFVELA